MGVPDKLITLVPGDQLDGLIIAFLDDCALANLSPKTLRFYGDNLRRYRWWCQEIGRVPLDPTRQTTPMVRDFLRYVQTADTRWDRPGNLMAERPASDKTLHAYYRTLRRFFNWLVEQEYIDRSPLAKIRAPKFRAESPEPFSSADLARLTEALVAAGDSRLATRDRAIIALLLDQGLRASELCGVQVADLDLATGALTIVHGKGAKTRYLVVGARARRPLRRWWLRHRQHEGDAGPFFVSARGGPLTPNAVHQLCLRLGKAAGVPDCHPHRFRHTAAISALRAGMGLFELQTMLGHADLQMVRHYTKIAGEDLARASRDHSALDHLGLSL